ncbi:MAG: ImmA/IrrE family metallo-endopeptidase [Acidobacteriia bacterium]|nr:ImmA/IrrE family metallo-endopeptidase [Terriglobia bacterium]
MLQQILSDARLDAKACAGLLGINPSIFDEWASGQRLIPQSIVPALATILGVEPDVFLVPSKKVTQAGAIWYKLRANELGESDREYVFLIRQLAHYLNELEEVTEERSIAWRSSFDTVFKNVDTQSAPREQGRLAARIFRSERGLTHGATGIGGVIRPHLRMLGLLVIESNIPESVLEGCSFYVGQRPNDRPCIFANNYRTTWHRRNMTLMHELAHAIFDAPGDAASLDYRAVDSITPGCYTDDVKEQRAQAFALECLIPKEVLRHATQTKGINWSRLQPEQLAMLVQLTTVEAGAVLTAAVEADYITHEQAGVYSMMDIGQLLRDIDERALTTDEYLGRLGLKDAPFAGKRSTTIPTRKLTLPVGYINRVLDAVRADKISIGRAAELLMIHKDTFIERFPAYAEVQEEW